MPTLLQDSPPPKTSAREAADTLLRQAIRHHKAGEIAEAERLYRGLLDSSTLAAATLAADASHNLGILLLQRREIEAALPLFKTAIDRNPSQSQFWVSYADALFQTGRFEQAGETLIAAARQGLRSDRIEALAARVDAASERHASPGGNWMPDLHGDLYIRVLDRLHRALQPRTYLEIGVETGATLALARCGSIGIDPQFQFRDLALVQRLVTKPSLSLYQMPSDDFFTRFDPTHLFGAPIDFAFLDGMHRCEYLLRDFLNTERHCHPKSIIALHDCLPLELPMADREPNAKPIDPARQGFWTGDVWRTALLLRRHRSDLRMLVLDAAPTGLILISNLNPHNNLFHDDFTESVAEMMGWSLAGLTLGAYDEEMGVEPEIRFRDANRILARLRIDPRAGSQSVPPPPAQVTSSPVRMRKSRPSGKQAAQRTGASQKSSDRSPHPSEDEVAAILALHQQAQYREAEKLARAITLRFPTHGFAWKALGVMLQKQGRFAEALEIKQHSAELLRDDPEAQNNLGNALLKLDRFDEAAVRYRKALALKPDYAEAESGLGITLQKLGQLAEAETHCRRSLSLRPDFADAYSNLGITLLEAGRLNESETCYQHALALEPDHAEAWNNLGITLQKLNRLAESEAAHRKAIKGNPRYADALTNLAGCLQQQARLDEAEACYRQAIEINPNQLNARTNLLFCLSHNPAVTPETLVAEHLSVGEHFEAPHRAGRRRHSNPPEPDRMLNVGFVSADLRVHATSHFIEPALTHLSRRPDLALHIYANHLLDDHITERFRAHIPRWNRVYGLSDDALAQKIRADGIDILVDLSGHTGGHRLSVFARKPAPIQIGWIGYLGTSGMKSIDYYFADRFYLPPGEFDRFFSEELLYLSAIAPFQPAPLQPNNDAPPVNSLPALANGFVTFASFSRMGKLSPEVIALWSRLLLTVPESKMLLGAMAGQRESTTLLAWFAANGIPASRLNFHLGTTMANYLQLHHQVDICLDPFPFTGATTTGHALWMGVPTITLLGQTAPGRLGPAMLQHVGLESFVVRTPEDFVSRGMKWAQDLESLAQLRGNLRGRVQQSPLGQHEAFATNLASAFRQTWQRWCASHSTEPNP
jgi:protein O-GlcNAc transferase